MDTEPSTPAVPVVFVSYSHDSPEHKRWVGDLASRLRTQGGADVILDQWHVEPGDDIPAFMERKLRAADRVVMVCTTTYTQKANDGLGGVGYEKMIVTGELVRDLGTTKFIPLVPPENARAVLPGCVQTRKYLDFRSIESAEAAFDELVESIHHITRLKLPPVDLSPKYRVLAEPSLRAPADAADVAPEASKSLLPLDSYRQAVAVLSSQDYQAWQHLVRRSRVACTQVLLRWRESLGPSGRLASSKDLTGVVLEAAEAFAPLMAVALAAVESGRERYRNQSSVLADILSPNGWTRNGLVIVVELPKALAFIFHALAGAMAVQSRQFDLVASLARTPLVSDSSSGTSRLYERRDVLAWVESFGGSFLESLKFLLGLHQKWPWLQELFGERGEFESSVSTYFLLLNTVCCIDLAQNGSEVDDYGFSVPPAFWFTSSDVARTALQRYLNDHHQVMALITEAKVTPTSVADLWDSYNKSSLRGEMVFRYNIGSCVRVIGNPIRTMIAGGAQMS